MDAASLHKRLLNNQETCTICQAIKIMAGLFPVIFAIILLWLYKGTFGSEWSHCQETWGQFGDFFGGILNPVISYFALIASVYAVYFGWKGLQEAKEQTRSNRVFDLFQLWVSEDMFRARTGAWEYLLSNGAIFPNEADYSPLVFIGDDRFSKDGQRDEYLRVMRILTFIASLNDLWDTDLIDQKFALRLFGNDLVDWYQIMKSVTATRKESPDGDSYGKRIEDWLNDEVRPFLARVDQELQDRSRPVTFTSE